MGWIALALISAATYGIIAVIDKLLLDRHFPSLSSYFAWVGIATLVYGVVFLLANGIPEGMPTGRMIVAGISGLCWGGAIALMFWGFKLQEVSRASAVLTTFPVFVAFLASAFLGEILSLGQWLAVAVVVIGAILISTSGVSRRIELRVNKYWNLEGSPKTRRLGLTVAFPILIGSSLLTALGHFTSKYALQELPVFLVTSLGFFGTAFVLIYLVNPMSLGQLLAVMARKEALLLMILSEGILIPIAVVTMIAATKLGPVSLVATIAGTRPIFILLYSILLSMPGIRIFNESLDRRILFVKVASVAMIIGGITLL